MLVTYLLPTLWMQSPLAEFSPCQKWRPMLTQIRHWLPGRRSRSKMLPSWKSRSGRTCCKRYRFWDRWGIGKNEQEKSRFYDWQLKNFIVLLLKLMKEKLSQNLYFLRQFFFYSIQMANQPTSRYREIPPAEKTLNYSSQWIRNPE